MVRKIPKNNLTQVLTRYKTLQETIIDGYDQRKPSTRNNETV